MSKGLIVRKAPGFLVPEAYLDKVFATKPTIIGAAAATKNGDINEILLAVNGEDPSKQWVVNGQDQFKDLDLLLYFGDKPFGTTEENVANCQPYVVARDGQAEAVVAFIEGVFPDFVEPESKLPAEFFLAHKHLLPRLQELYDKSGKDETKLFETLRQDRFRREMGSLWDGRGVIALLNRKGELISFNDPKDTQRRSFEWGSVTRHLDYSEGAVANTAPAEQVAEPVKPAFFGKGAPKATVTVPEAAPEPQKEVELPQTEVSPSVLTPAEDDVDAEKAVLSALTYGEIKDGKYYIYPGPDCNSRTKLKKFYGKWGHFQPQNYAERPPLEVTKTSYDQYMSSINKGLSKRAEAKAAREAKSTSVPEVKSTGYKSFQDAGAALGVEPSKAKDTASKHIPDRTQGGTQSPVGGIPVLSAQSKAKVETLLKGETMKTILDARSKVIIDPAYLKDMEEKIPSFAEQVPIDGLHLDDISKWDYAVFMKLVHDTPEAAAVLLCNYALDYLKGRSTAELEKINAPKTEPAKVPEPEPVVVEPPKKVAAGGGRNSMFDL